MHAYLRQANKLVYNLHSHQRGWFSWSRIITKPPLSISLSLSLYHGYVGQPFHIPEIRSVKGQCTTLLPVTLLLPQHLTLAGEVHAFFLLRLVVLFAGLGLEFIAKEELVRR